MLPLSVDLPASTCPMNTKFKCSRGSPSTASTSIVLLAGFGFDIVVVVVASAAASVSSSIFISAMASAAPLPSPPVSQSSSSMAAAPSPEAMSASTSGYFNNDSGLSINFTARSLSPLHILVRTSCHSGSFSSISDADDDRDGAGGVGVGSGAGAGAAGAGAATPPGVHSDAAADGFHSPALAFMVAVLRYRIELFLWLLLLICLPISVKDYFRLMSTY
mmetsp:Transcript_23789/g.43093  ORF Transcript_23789/g.43093 Transcript_23789/m.43093 type:complete len:219 (+) Transcript_23789:1498-2154(+)